MKRINILVCCLLNVLWASAQFSGSGSGTSTDPYRIFNADQLTQLRNFLNQEGVYFKLQNDIDLTDWLAENYPSQGWQPVGSSTEPFKGILDGNNKTISGFSITRSSTDYVGLFAYVTGATIKDLTLKGNISGKAYVGSLIGSGSATVTNYTFEGNVTGTGNYTGGVGGYQTTSSTNLTVKATVKGASYTGGIYGYGAGITTATFTGQVTGTSSYVGGLEGSASGTFSSCTVSGPVKSTSSSATYIGGLIGFARSTVTANNCKQEGIVQGKSYTGGLVGYTSSNITINSNTHRGNITGTTYTGGAIGGSKSGAVSLASCYVEGNIVGTTSVGGICGIVENPGASNIIGCNYWGDISGTSQLGGVIGFITGTTNTIDFTATTTAGYRQGQGYASYSGDKCFFNVYNPTFSYINSSGAIINYYVNDKSQIATPSNLGAWVKSTTYAAYYYGNNNSDYIQGVGEVYNNIRNTSTSRNVNIVNCSAISNINGTSSYIGGIIGKDLDGNNAYYSQSSSKTVYYYQGNGTTTSTTSLTLKAYNYIYTTTNISESYFSGSLAGTDYIGGVAGSKQGGCVNNCYASASINGGNYVGGIAGYLTKESLNTNENSMNSNVSVCTTITGTSNVGRIYGYTDGNFTMAALGTQSENRSMASTQVVVNGVTQTITDNLQNGSAVGVSQLRYMSSYVAWGWDFNNCWTIQETESFPYKTWQSAPPTFSGKLYSGATTISGKSVDGGIVHLTTSSGKTYSATCSGSNWSVSVDALHAGETVTAYVEVANKEKSYFTTTTVGFLGSGTEDDPYQITSAEDLQGINTGGYYKIMNDINLTSWINQNSSSKGWVPIGYDGSAVYIDGDGHKISGLWTNSTDTYTGLFSKLKDGYIKNLNVEVASGKKVKGGQYTGIIIGYATSFEISNCSVNGNAEGTTYVGGLVGYIAGNSSNPNLTNLTYEGSLSSSTASAKIGGIAGYASTCRMSNVSSIAQITSTGNSSVIGGLVGNMYGLTASQCTADVNITASGTGCKTGGLFGTAGYSTSTATTIFESYSTGIIQVTGSDSWTGGIAGALITNCQLSDSYSTATISGTQYTAGLVGQASAASKINRCYATGNLTGVYYGAGIVGYLNDANTKTTNCVALNNILSYTDQSAWACRVIGGYDEASGDPDGSNLALATMQVSLNNVPVKKYDDLVEGIAKSEAELKQAATYEAKGWDFNNVWTMPADGYPLLKWQMNTSVISDLSELSNNKLYTFTSKRGRIIRKSDGSGLQGESARDDETEADTRFAILKIDGAYYLYSPVDKKFFLSGIEDGGEFKRYTASPISFDDTHPDGDYLWVVNTTDPNGNTMCFNYNGTYKIEINTWGVTTGMFDDGNRWIITAVSDFDPTEALEQFETDISISLNQELLSLSIGGSATLTASILPADADLTVQWSSSNPEVASVNNGVVTAIAAGNATITATTNEVTNLTATCEVTVTNGSVETGDANGDGGVNVADYMAIANYILGVTVANFNATAADVNTDGDVNVTDYVGVANIILYGNYQGNVPNAIMALNAEPSTTWLDIENTEDGKMRLFVHDAKPFAAFQMDISLPEGLEIVDANMAKANQTKNLGFTRLQDGTWRLLYGTLENKAVNLVDDNLLTLELASNKTNVGGFVVVDDIFVTDRYASTLRLNVVQNGLPTGIYSIERGMVVIGDCYDLSGRKVDNSQLKKGVYIINGKKIIK